MITRIATLAAVAVLFVSFDAQAKSFRVQQIPNASQFNCDTCHEPGNTGYVNPFGVQVLSHLSGGDVKWEEMWNLDADGDGYTNGEEMGDPNGTWRIGMPNPSFRATHPGYADQNLCNNGILSDNEACDGNELRGETCESQGYATGGLGCNALCQYDVSNCSNCGNGIVELGDQCDGEDFGGTTCESLGFDGGSLTCLSNCKVDYSQCTGEPAPNCGDGIRVTGEECEDTDLAQRTCTSLGWSGGELQCSDTCTFDTSACSGTGPDRERLVSVPNPTGGDGGDSSSESGDSDSACSSTAATPVSTLPWLAVLFVFGWRRRR